MQQKIVNVLTAINQPDMKKSLNPCEDSFRPAIMAWGKKNIRPMPWKGIKDPYKVWLSEIMLQQTRVEQGKPYYERFIHAYPHIEDLARAEERDVFRLWQGLGYYNRCKNMLAAARKIMDSHGGAFPSEYADILALPGVGTYSAAAIASFAFNLPYAVVDGNVYRVLARYFGIRKTINNLEGKKFFAALAERLLDKKDPALYNQAIMDFGATLCTPKQPDCGGCPLKACCYASQHGMISELPVKTVKRPPRHRHFYYLVFSYKDRLYIRRRDKKDIWKNLYDFILYEGDAMSEKEVLDSEKVRSIQKENPFQSVKVSPRYHQQLTHQRIDVVFLRISLKSPLKNTDCIAIPEKNLHDYPFPRVIVRYLEDEKRFDA